MVQVSNLAAVLNLEDGIVADVYIDNNVAANESHAFASEPKPSHDFFLYGMTYLVQ